MNERLRELLNNSNKYALEAKKSVLGRGGEISLSAGLKDLSDAITNIPVGSSLAFKEDSTVAYRKIVPSKAEEYALVKKIGGLSYKCNNLITFPYYDTTKTLNGITFTVLEDKSIQVNGTTTAFTSFTIAIANAEWTMGERKGKNFTFSNSGTAFTGRDGTYCEFSFRNPDGSWLVGSSLTDGNAQSFSVTEDAELGGWYCYIGIAQGVTVNNAIYKLMFNEGTTALPYEPFFKGLRETKVERLESRGKNLFNANKPNLCRFGFTDEIYELASRSIYIPCEGNTIYTISKVGNIAETMLRLGTTDVTPTIGVKILNKNVGGSDINSLTLTTHANAKYLVAMITTSRFSGDINEVLSTIQIECGETATEYKPFEVLDTFPIPEEIFNREDWGRGVNENYYNAIEYIDGRWYYIPRTKRKVFDGTGNWYLYNGSTFYTMDLTDALYSTNGACVSSHFRALASGTGTSGGVGDCWFQYETLYPRFYIGFAADITTIAQAKAHLAELYAKGNPLMIDYAVANPKPIDITDLITRSKFLKTEGGGHIIAHNEHENGAPTTIKYTVKVG